jgi:hypothetical protein
MNGPERIVEGGCVNPPLGFPWDRRRRSPKPPEQKARTKGAGLRRVVDLALRPGRAVRRAIQRARRRG